MTRINCVPVEELSGPHLVAEYRELPRVFALAEKSTKRTKLLQPETYTLGKGHVLFFYTRLGYLQKRHAALIAEMKRREYNPSFTGVERADFPLIPDHYWSDWTPTEEALAINRQRIQERERASLEKQNSKNKDQNQ
ncbi:pyrimidine dimer DNA glycosylase/endonuclease V [Paenalcaligenes sp. Me131]|uniref:pyrimidine dimer DNA glycosylase/endonuclease V n=1 Tax=Paenalcaligenes sp. Me131 TaxID=3392636 RepID=UPI003D2E38B8